MVQRIAFRLYTTERGCQRGALRKTRRLSVGLPCLAERQGFGEGGIEQGYRIAFCENAGCLGGTFRCNDSPLRAICGKMTGEAIGRFSNAPRFFYILSLRHHNKPGGLVENPRESLIRAMKFPRETGSFPVGEIGPMPLSRASQRRRLWKKEGLYPRYPLQSPSFALRIPE